MDTAKHNRGLKVMNRLIRIAEDVFILGFQSDWNQVYRHCVDLDACEDGLEALKNVLVKHGYDLSVRDMIGEIGSNYFGWFIGQFLEKTDLRGASLEGADLGGADLEGADLQGAKLRWANLQGAGLEGADLWEANLQYANFRRANLHRACIREANLKGADLRGANRRGAKLNETSLYGAFLTDARL